MRAMGYTWRSPGAQDNSIKGDMVPDCEGGKTEKLDSVVVQVDSSEHDYDNAGDGGQ